METGTRFRGNACPTILTRLLTHRSALIVAGWYVTTDTLAGVAAFGIATVTFIRTGGRGLCTLVDIYALLE